MKLGKWIKSLSGTDQLKEVRVTLHGPADLNPIKMADYDLKQHNVNGPLTENVWGHMLVFVPKPADDSSSSSLS